MSIPKLISTAFALFLFYFSFSQPICGFDAVHARRMQDPVYRQRINNYESNINKYIQLHNNLKNSKANPSVLGGVLYTIPVVVHVVHTGAAIWTIYNPTDAQIQGAIDYLNEVYNGSYPGLEGVKDLQIQFALAQRDPNCNASTGIVRVNGSGISGYASGGVNVSTSLGTDEINVKNLSRWDPTQYYNIWVVDKIDGADGTSGTFVAGFAYFPGGDPNYDGTIMLATQMISGQKTLPHEIGHAFNLYHPFQGSTDKNTCPANSNCNTDGDQICDTDPISYNQLGGIIDFSCRTGNTNACTGTPYSINTENNFMNYTSCYDLFTSDQKTRMLASAASPDRVNLANSLGATAPNAGATPCSPKINFEIDNDQVTEAATTTAGCRSYTDYTYQMVIGNGPSVTATATLNIISATATEGLDFDITTNGNFASPSKTLTFPAASIAAQSFTIRIYDDASVEGTENFVLGFTVNNGGGNAVAGDGNPNLTITINDNDAAPYGPANISKSIGASSTTLQSPFAASNSKQKSQILYTAAELSAVGIKAGNITGLSLNIVKQSGAALVYNGLTIKMGQTAHGSLYNMTTQFPLSDAGFTTTYSSNYTTVNGWNNFSFSTPFTWDGVSNVVVEICYDNGAATDVDDNCLGYTDGNANSSYVFKTGINCNTAFSGGFGLYNSGLKPIIQFIYADPGTQVQTSLNSSIQEYLGPNSDIYFYDQVSHQLMARIQNQSSFDYGCTQVVIDRAGSSATAFWNNSPANYLMDKTFRVLPANNNPTGAYTITLYYTQSEVNGWQSATGQNISSIQLVKASNAISLVTPGNPAGAGVVVTGNPTLTTLGTSTGLAYNFTTGFSGFGAGVVGTVLPIGLLNFEGQLKNNTVLLNWTTATEANSKAFEIERAYDAINFVKIGTLAAAGNSAINRNYSFSDPGIAQQENYYRLKQIDLNGKYTYSQVILIKNAADRFFAVLNNPFTNYIDIQFGERVNGKLQVRLLDITGRELLNNMQEATGLTAMRIDLSQKSISAGIYLLELSFNNEKYVKRVLKQ